MMKVTLKRDIKRDIKMSLLDITKIFSMFQPREDDEGEDERQALNLAVSQDDYQLLDELLRQERYKGFINSRSGWGVPGTPLRFAASKGHLRCVEVLLAHGAEVDSLDVKAQTPLFVAVNNGHLDCVRALLRAGANPSGSIHNNCTPLLTAARDGDVDILQELLEHGAEVNVKARVPEWAANSVACSGPLYLSAVYGHLECFKMLLLYGADPNYNCNDEKMVGRVKSPKTLLEICLRHGCGAEFVQLLIDFGANVYLPGIKLDKISASSEVIDLLAREREGDDGKNVPFVLLGKSIQQKPCFYDQLPLEGEQKYYNVIWEVVPKSLMSQCRLAIRKFLKPANQPSVVDQLEIPSTLLSYLKHQL